jgi:hypothetical protein
MGHWLAQERSTVHLHEALCGQETRPHRLRASVSSGIWHIGTKQAKAAIDGARLGWPRSGA